MLNQLSWTTYFEIVIFFTAIYYLFVLFRYYREDARKMLQPQSALTDDTKVPEVLRYQQPAPAEEIKYPAVEARDEDILDQIQNEDFAVAEIFIRQLKECIKNASAKPFAPAVLIPQIKKLFRENPDLANSPQRPSINELIVQECESTGTALLTEDEVDQWWTD